MSKDQLDDTTVVHAPPTVESHDAGDQAEVLAEAPGATERLMTEQEVEELFGQAIATLDDQVGNGELTISADQARFSDAPPELQTQVAAAFTEDKQRLTAIHQDNAGALAALGSRTGSDIATDAAAALETGIVHDESESEGDVQVNLGHEEAPQATTEVVEEPVVDSSSTEQTGGSTSTDQIVGTTAGSSIKRPEDMTDDELLAQATFDDPGMEIDPNATNGSNVEASAGDGTTQQTVEGSTTEATDTVTHVEETPEPAEQVVEEQPFVIDDEEKDTSPENIVDPGLTAAVDAHLGRTDGVVEEPVETVDASSSPEATVVEGAQDQADPLEQLAQAQAQRTAERTPRPKSTTLEQAQNLGEIVQEAPQGPDAVDAGLTAAVNAAKEKAAQDAGMSTADQRRLADRTLDSLRGFAILKPLQGFIDRKIAKRAADRVNELSSELVEADGQIKVMMQELEGTKDPLERQDLQNRIIVLREKQRNLQIEQGAYQNRRDRAIDMTVSRLNAETGEQQERVRQLNLGIEGLQARVDYFQDIIDKKREQQKQLSQGGYLDKKGMRAFNDAIDAAKNQLAAVKRQLGKLYVQKNELDVELAEVESATMGFQDLKEQGKPKVDSLKDNSPRLPKESGPQSQVEAGDQEGSVEGDAEAQAEEGNESIEDMEGMKSGRELIDMWNTEVDKLNDDAIKAEFKIDISTLAKAAVDANIEAALKGASLGLTKAELAVVDVDHIPPKLAATFLSVYLRKIDSVSIQKGSDEEKAFKDIIGKMMSNMGVES